MDTEKFEASEWELINPKNISFGLNNHDGLIWELMVSIKAESGYIRGMPIGFIVQANPELEDGPYPTQEPRMKFLSNKFDEAFIYRMIMSGNNVMFFRKARIKNE